MKETIISLYRSTKLALRAVREDAKEFMTDKSVPLETRWEFFLTVQDMLEVSESLPKFKNEEGEDLPWEFWQSSTFLERHQTLEFQHLIDCLMGDADQEKHFQDLPGGDWKYLYTDDKINHMMEQVLATGEQGFTYDW